MTKMKKYIIGGGGDDGGGVEADDDNYGYDDIVSDRDHMENPAHKVSRGLLDLRYGYCLILCV